jgi:Caspase domain
MSRNLLTKLLILSCVILNGMDATTLHTIIIGDTLDESIGETVEVDIHKIRKEMQEIAYYTEMNLNETLITGTDVNHTIIDRVDRLQVDSDDVVFIYYSGHGYRRENSKDNQWPNFYLSSENKGINQYDLTNRMVKKNPRLVLSLADACNNRIPDKWAPPVIKKRAMKFHNEGALTRNYCKLFLESSGTIIISGASPGYYSYCDWVNGGHYTCYFLTLLDQQVNNTSMSPDWRLLLDECNFLLWEDQKPQYQILF